MGILNVTPDSFSDGSKYCDAPSAVRHALEMVKEGADIIDVGGESSRPGSEPIGIEEELHRVVPVIKAIREKNPDITISVDTRKAAVAAESCNAGADMINDISALMFDPEMAETVARSGAYIVLMHMKGTPRDMQKEPYYSDVISEVEDFLHERLECARECGIDEERIILDPGIGFGKRVEDNLRIIKELSRFKTLGRPILVGSSMKSFIGKLTDWDMEGRVEGTLASIAIAIWNGADIVRVHDVRKTRKVVTIVDAVMRS